VVVTELEERRVGLNLGHRSSSFKKKFIGSHSPFTPLVTFSSPSRDFLDPRPHLGTSSQTLCRSGGSTPHSLHGHCCCGPPDASAAPRQVSPELLGSQVPPTRSEKAPPPVIRTVAPTVVACSEVPAD
jgi:hypothetical protein